jgi:hypothetical protein
MEIPQELFVYTRQFFIVFGSSGELLLQTGVKVSEEWATRQSELRRIRRLKYTYIFTQNCHFQYEI